MKTKTYDECYFLNYEDYSDLLLYETGCQQCLPGYAFGPIIRENFVLHYIINGRGTLYIKDEAHNVQQGEAFITFPHSLAYYQADEKEPWNYIWIHFNGAKAIEVMRLCGISEMNPVFRPKSGENGIAECVTEILHKHDREYLCIGNLYKLFQLMQDACSRGGIRKADNQLLYIKKVIEYIQFKYFDAIHISDLAAYCGLNRSYLTKLFKEATGYSPQEYLIDFRLKKAKQLLKEKDMPVSHVAYAVGYTDPLAFSKIFRKKEGMSPLEYRERSENRNG